MRLIFGFLLLYLSASAQQVGQNSPSTAGQATFHSTTQVVIETVVVRDKSGNPVDGLGAKDFSILEDGTPQTIQFFEFLRVPEISEGSMLAEPGRPKLRERLPKTRISPEAPGKIRYGN